MSETATAFGRHLLTGSVELGRPEEIGSGYVAILWCQPAPGVEVGVPLTEVQADQLRRDLKPVLKRARRTS